MNKLLCKPVMLSTKDKSFFFETTNGEITLTSAIHPNYLNHNWNHQHLYLVSDREIGPYEWFYASDHMSINKNEWKNSKALKQEFPWYHKIEATTDKSLGLPLIPTSFIEEYIQKQGKIDKVYIRTQTFSNGESLVFYKVTDREVVVMPVKDSWNREEFKFEMACAFGAGKSTGLFSEWFNKNY